ncbi:MAG: hypothetical protein KJ630_11805 [Proteobacteria bacterium]|nr:hypothetical protein [Pseudomonadota bacterium]
MEKQQRRHMRIIFILTIFSFFFLGSTTHASNAKLPLDKRISIERLLLIEEYKIALQTCRERARKAAKDSCIEKKKDLLAKTFDDLQYDPKAYFTRKDGNMIHPKDSDK